MLLWLFRVFMLLTCCLGQPRSSFAQNAVPPWLELSMGTISLGSADVLKSAFLQIEKQQLGGLVIVLDTAGGSLDATRTMVQDILNAPVPVVVWVGPNGAHAGSAGTFITLAGHVAAMAPGTNIGAARPIDSSGQNLDEESDLREKIENDTLAFMESIAQTRGRNRELANSFVANSLSITAQEALDGKVIDLISPDLPSLLNTIHGRQIQLGPKTHVIASAGAKLLPYERSWRQGLLEILGNPTLFYLLFVVGLLALAFEITHPGVIAPGVIGAICLLLALIASSVLPVSFGAMLLVAASLAFMIAELFLPSFGVLGIGGLVGFVTGSVLLFDEKSDPSLRLSLWLIVPVAILLLLAMLGLARLLLRNQRSKAKTGTTTLLGAAVEAVEYFVDGRGRVRISGEYWNASEENHATVRPGDRLQVTAVDGLHLRVKLLQPTGKE